MDIADAIQDIEFQAAEDSHHSARLDHDTRQGVGFSESQLGDEPAVRRERDE